jgi:hypothetical protein
VNGDALVCKTPVSDYQRRAKRLTGADFEFIATMLFPWALGHEESSNGHSPA